MLEYLDNFWLHLIDLTYLLILVILHNYYINVNLAPLLPTVSTAVTIDGLSFIGYPVSKSFSASRLGEYAIDKVL